MRRAPLAALLIAASLAACKGDKFTEPQTLGGKSIAADVLNDGMKVYLRYCATCHGTNGDGKTNSAGRQKMPRDLTLGQYKFSSVADSGLPTDADLARTVRLGVRGTQMVGYPDLDETELMAVVHYIKTFAKRWRREDQGEPIPTHDNPFGAGKRMEGVARGKVVYHAAAQCWQCHPAYAPSSEILAMAQAEDRRAGKPARKSMPFRSKLADPAMQDTVYGRLRPPDFLRDTLPMARDRKGLYRAIGAGIGGTDMPAWVSRLSPRDLWAVVLYVEDLVRKRGTKKGLEIRARVQGATKKPSRD